MKSLGKGLIPRYREYSGVGTIHFYAKLGLKRRILEGSECKVNEMVDGVGIKNYVTHLPFMT